MMELMLWPTMRDTTVSSVELDSSSSPSEKPMVTVVTLDQEPSVKDPSSIEKVTLSPWGVARGFGR